MLLPKLHNCLRACLTTSLTLWLASSAINAQLPSLTGRWHGVIAAGGDEIELYASTDPHREPSRITCDFPDIDRTCIADIEIMQDSLRFVVQADEYGKITLTGLMTDSLVSGSAASNDQAGAFYLRRLYDVTNEDEQTYVGFYRDSDGNPLCVMHRARGGLTFYNFDGLVVGSRYPTGKCEYARFGDAGEITSRWQFVSDAEGSIANIEVRNSDGTSETWVRIERPPFAQRSVSYQNGDISLSGVLLIPADVIDPPAIVYIHGSGAGNTRNDFYDLYICQYLAGHGVATLLSDKRGSGESEGDWRLASMTDFAADAMAGVKFLKSQTEFEYGRVGVLGYSQGGWAVPVVAATPGAADFTIDVSGSALSIAPTVTYEVEQLAREAGLSGADFERIASLQKEAVAYARGDVTWDAFKSDLDEAISHDWPGRDIAAGFPQTSDHWKWAFHRRNLDFDPIVYWQKALVPSLIVYGKEDGNVPVGESLIKLDRSLSDAVSKRVEIKVYEGSGHGIGDPDTGWIRREFLDFLVEWITNQG